MAATSFQQNKQKHLFAKKSIINKDYLVALILSCVLLVLDYKQNLSPLKMRADTDYTKSMPRQKITAKLMHSLRYAISIVSSPVQLSVDAPKYLAQHFEAYLHTKNKIIDENNALKITQANLNLKLQKLESLEKQNTELRALFGTNIGMHHNANLAQVLMAQINTNRQIVVINKGSNNGVTIGQPVFDTKGVIGQIIDVGSLTSTVLLISDNKCAVPVQNARTGERAILVGTNNPEQLSLINLPKTSNIEIGDLLITSGLGRRYPQGYPVGYVYAIKHLPGEDFIKILVKPAASLNKSDLVLLLAPTKDYPMNEQINERIDQARQILS
jgi:rod shape-determining protein MreC